MDGMKGMRPQARKEVSQGGGGAGEGKGRRGVRQAGGECTGAGQAEERYRFRRGFRAVAWPGGSKDAKETYIYFKKKW